MNLQYEWLQEITVHTKKDSILRLHLSNVNNQFRLYGEFFDSEKKEWTLVDFSTQRVNNCNKLLEDCLRDFNTTITQEGDTIIAVKNPCNTPFVTGEQQQVIIQNVGLIADVSINQ